MVPNSKPGAVFAMMILSLGLGSFAARAEQPPPADQPKGAGSPGLAAPGLPEGVYKLVELSQGTMKVPDEVVKKYGSFTVKGDKLVTDAGSGPRVVTITRVDTKSVPASVDMTPEFGPDKGKLQKGIWKLEKGVLTISLAGGPGGARPVDFRGDKDIHLVLVKDGK